MTVNFYAAEEMAGHVLNPTGLVPGKGLHSKPFFWHRRMPDLVLDRIDEMTSNAVCTPFMMGASNTFDVEE